ncbi:hypothetical protein [Psilogramma increta granulovirus]|uniref:Uncharacterized protein n=1 Tax=Psilogramma increta granulovirus TaxID=2953508 RepID=A0A977XU74_9BBAC|nr:hypothetical protein [Psilogramma increta granulovirus]
MDVTNNKENEQHQQQFKLKMVIEKTVQNAYDTKDWSKTRNGKTWHMRHLKKTW